ncbi:uncharacterized membrane protein [Desulfocapsa sulfexigens DSM 10523]|uniref:Uncharacterized membrane protein n=1 Tax=Desulfocapsa sulfexigens (strain DSM 10523 / SB164P1) TaxID=1167006 RepID=M1PNL0_DESSD|nr:stage II sporulation protein M [Desulfocapsa sulfexigens]AGF77991.1 uncharacterized membrane protein [Desulfocapsa sulfexigens DSM 10523]
MFTKENKTHFHRAWIRLIFAYLSAFFLSFAVGSFLIQIMGMSPETLFEFSTKRVSYAFPVFQAGTELGVDLGLVLFFWNSLASIITISFLYTAPLFNPRDTLLFPQTIRKMLCGRRRMKLLCFLPGCLKFEEESLRRVYVWLMVPWLGMILLGMESGLTVSTSSYAFGSYGVGFLSLIPHGVVEIPTIALAGAVVFAVHLVIKKESVEKNSEEIFAFINSFKQEVPLRRIVLFVMSFLFVAGLVEGHITPKILDALVQ